MNTTSLLSKTFSIAHEEIIRQCKEENDCWKRVLGFQQAENNYLKIRLAHLVNQEIGHKFLPRAEHLQNELIQKDELIALNRTALSNFDKYLNNHIETEKGIKDILKIRNKARGQMELLEQKFSRYRTVFNDHLFETLKDGL